jgi:hypothetical protein
MQTGVPAKPAANVSKLVVGFEPSFSAPALVAAAAATAAWVWLVRWRTGRHREALWKSLVLPAGGVTLCLVLLMTLGLPVLDYARSNRAIVERIARHVPVGGCIAAPGQSLSLIAALEHHGRYRVDGRALRLSGACAHMVRVEPREPVARSPEGFVLVARERRPTDRANLVAIYRRLPTP